MIPELDKPLELLERLVIGRARVGCALGLDAEVHRARSSPRARPARPRPFPRCRSSGSTESASATTSSEASMRSLDAFSANQRAVESRSDGPASTAVTSAVARLSGESSCATTPLTPSSTSSTGVLCSRDDDARRTVCSRLDDDEPVPLALRRGRETCGSCHRGVDLLLRSLARACGRSRRGRPPRRSVRCVAAPGRRRRARAAGRSAARASANARTSRSTRFSRTWRPA